MLIVVVGFSDVRMDLSQVCECEYLIIFLSHPDSPAMPPSLLPSLSLSLSFSPCLSLGFSDVRMDLTQMCE